ncbi:hypothetical protein ACFQZQ_12505 [Lysobacter koreensis]|uniref:CopG family transcriptional regulator n=1 Tax=Lysobacter koreensis TaxID=266122 RepID=A0ABW2YNV0_9GAMM
MKNSKRRIRNFRIGDVLDERLKAVADLVGTEPSTLLRDFVKDGTSLIIESQEVQERLRKRYL